MMILLIILQTLSLLATLVVCVKYVRLRKEKDSQYYTDYRHKNTIVRVYKPEFEHYAIGDVPRDKLLDRGVFSQFYFWVLIEL